MVCSVILAGGAGTRLWPLSNNDVPKQFLKLFSNDSMIVETSKRVLPRVPIEKQYVLTGEKYAALVEKEFAGKINMLAEPMAKNTAPCILWAAQKIKKDHGEDTVMIVMPSDHAIKDEYSFMLALDMAIEAAHEGKIATFGIVPTRPETGYGYIEIENADYEANRTVTKLKAFREKPDAKKAEEFLAAGNYLWNGGIFIFTPKTIIGEFEKYCPDVYNCFKSVDPDDKKDIKKAFESVQSISIDYAIMEHTEIAVCIPADFGWSDVGGYQSLHSESEKDENGNAFSCDTITVDVKGCYISASKRVVGIGLEDLVIVESGDTILVAKKNRADEVGDIAKRLNKGK